MSGPKELHKVLVSSDRAAPVVVLTFSFTESSDADATVPLFYASRKMRFVGGKYVQSVDATAATTYTATLEVGSTALSEALDIKTLADATVADLLPSATSADRNIAEGDLVEIAFDETGGSATSPEDVNLTLEFLLLE